MMRGPDLHCAVDRVQLQQLSEVESRQRFYGGNSHKHGYNHAPVRLKIFRQYFRSLRRVQPTQHAHATSSGTRLGRVALEERAGGPGGGDLEAARVGRTWRQKHPTGTCLCTWARCKPARELGVCTAEARLLRLNGARCTLSLKLMLSCSMSMTSSRPSRKHSEIAILQPVQRRIPLLMQDANGLRQQEYSTTPPPSVTCIAPCSPET